MFARRTAEGILQHITGYSAIFAEPTAYVALFTTAPTDDTGTSAVEVSGGAYARVATTAGASGTWAAASTTTDPTTIANSGTTNAAITFPTASANWGTVVAFGLYDAATGGNLLAWDWLGNFQWLPATISAANPGVFTAHAHGFTAGAPVVYSTVFGGTAPTLATGSANWAASTAYSTGQLIKPTVGNAGNYTFEVTVAGTSSSTEPAWPQTVGGTVTDGGVTWTNVNTGSGALGSNNISLVVAPTTDTFTLTTGSANTPVNTAATGNGMVRQIVQQSVPSGVQPSFASGQLVLQAA